MEEIRLLYITTWGCIKPGINNGRNYQPQLVPDFWTINSSMLVYGNRLEMRWSHVSEVFLILPSGWNGNMESGFEWLWNRHLGNFWFNMTLSIEDFLGEGKHIICMVFYSFLLGHVASDVHFCFRLIWLKYTLHCSIILKIIGDQTT